MSRTTREDQDRVALHEQARAKARSNRHAIKLLSGQMRRHGQRSMLRRRPAWR